MTSATFWYGVLAVSIAVLATSGEVLSKYPTRSLAEIFWSRYYVGLVLLNALFCAVFYTFLPELSGLFVDSQASGSLSESPGMRALVAGFGYLVLARTSVMDVKFRGETFGVGGDAIYNACAQYVLRRHRLSIDRRIREECRNIYAGPGTDEPATFLQAIETLFLFVSPAALSVTSVKDLIAYAKTHPGQVNFASSGVGSGLHLAGELFKALAKIDIVHVPYKGVSQALPELVAGKMQMVFYPITFHSFVKEGKLRALVFTATERSPVLPEVPTSAEIGMPELLASSWHAVVAPAGIPAERTQKLYQTLATVMADKELREALVKVGADPVGSSPEQFNRFLRAELAKWLKVIQFSGAKVEQ